MSSKTVVGVILALLTALLVVGLAGALLGDHILPQARVLWLSVVLVLFLILFFALDRFRHSHNQLSQELTLLEQYRKVADESAYISKTDPKGIITYANDRFCQISGYAKEELMGRPHNIVRHPDMPSSAFEEMWQTVRSGQVWHGIIKNRNRAGEAYFVESTIAPIRDDRGQIVEFIALRYDVTAREEALRQAQAAREAKDRFLANMSHEIRTPLNAILGFVELVSEEVGNNERAKSYLQTITRNSKTLLGVINDVLDFAKIESGKLEFEPVPSKLKEEIKSVTSLFSAMAAKKQIALEEVWFEPFPACVVLDPFRLRQILGNLLSNAIKFSPPGATITVRASYDATGGVVSFAVIDEGVGIDEAWQEKIFDAFLQVRSSDSSLHGGTGLGLPISRALARRMGGDVTVSSQVDQGSSFVVSLPARIFQERRQRSISNQKFNAKGLRVLIAEDQPDNQLLIRLLLERMGFEVTMTADGQEALSSYAEGRFDLILLDENMPNLTGTQTLHALRKQGIKEPVVILTANAVKGDRERFIKTGFDGYLSKPIQKTDLIRFLVGLFKERA